MYAMFDETKEYGGKSLNDKELWTTLVYKSF